MCLDKFTLEASGIYLCLNYVEENNKKSVEKFIVFYFVFFFSFCLHGDSIPGPLAPLADKYAHTTTAPHFFYFVCYLTPCRWGLKNSTTSVDQWTFDRIPFV